VPLLAIISEFCCFHTLCAGLCRVPVCSLDALRALMAADVKCLVVNLPHNPSGWLPSRQEWGDIIACARQVGLCGDM
jgi:histidinol-phosphate/aromatic aminotransferase/cobyric acid decarboxylase-like protein